MRPIRILAPIVAAGLLLPVAGLVVVSRVAEAPLRPVVVAPAPTVIGGEPRRLAAPPPALLVGPARQAWYDEVGARVAEVDRECGWGGVDVACEADVCALRAREPWDAANAARSYWRRPRKLVDRALVRLGILAPTEVSCVGAAAPLVAATFELPHRDSDRGWEGSGAPGDGAGEEPRACLIQHRSDGVDAPSPETREVGARLCAILDARALARR